MSLARRLLIFLYALAGVAAVVTAVSLVAGFPDLWPDGYQLTAFLAVTLLVFVVGLIAIVDFLIWPGRTTKPIGVRLMSVVVVAMGFVTGYLIGTRVSVGFQSELDGVVDVVGPGDPILSVALAIVVACLGALFVWLGIRNGSGESQ